MKPLPGKCLLWNTKNPNLFKGMDMMLATAMKRLKKNEKGFTLIELLAVIVILGIIAAIAVPMILGAINKSKTDSDLATERQIYDAARLYVTSELNGDFSKVTATTPIIITDNDPVATTHTLVRDGYLETNLRMQDKDHKGPVIGGSVTFNANGTLNTMSIIITNSSNVQETITVDPSKIK